MRRRLERNSRKGRRLYEQDMDHMEYVNYAVWAFEEEFNCQIGDPHDSDANPYGYSEYRYIQTPGDLGVFGLGAEVGFSYSTARDEGVVEIWMKPDIDGQVIGVIECEYIIAEDTLTAFEVVQ